MNILCCECVGQINVNSLYVIVLTGFETQNKYKVRNALGQQVYFAAEGEVNTQTVCV